MARLPTRLTRRGLSWLVLVAVLAAVVAALVIAALLKSPPNGSRSFAAAPPAHIAATGEGTPTR